MAVAQSTPIVRSNSVDLHAAHITEASQRFGIPEHWIRAVLRAESAGDVRAISSAGAMGLMQVMPDTWAELRARHGLGRDPYAPRDNILAGVAYLREMFDRYGNVAAMLAAYNAGPGRYDEHLATGRALPAETRAYVAALAPILGGATATEAPSSTPPPPPDWREAPLFVMRPCGAAGRQHFRGERQRRRNAMKAALPRSAVLVSASSWAGLRPAGFPAGRAEKTERAEGKIKEDGTMSGRFWKLLLSAYWLGGRFRHHGFEGPRAAISRKALALQGFERHHRRRSAAFRRFGLESRP